VTGDFFGVVGGVAAAGEMIGLNSVLANRCDERVTARKYG
jgi:hypothetical protein